MPADHERATLALDRISFSYGSRPALQDLSASFQSRRIAILGPNGAGKSTLMSILDSSRSAGSGSFSHDGLCPGRGDLREYRKRLGVVPQSLAMLPGYSCSELLRYVCWLRQVPAREVEGRVAAALTAVGLGDRARTAVRHLSGGMRQRLALAQALVNEPSILLLDEPTVGLDPQQRMQFRHMLQTLTGTTVVFATHLVDDVAAVAEEVLVLGEGKSLWYGTLADFVGSNPLSADTIERRYLQLVEHA